MESKQKNDKIILELTNEEAIVLLDWLSRFNQVEKSDLFQDQSEERVLWDIESCLEKVITETFNPDYDKILFEARKKVRD